jgi:hypothetical protein
MALMFKAAVQKNQAEAQMCETKARMCEAEAQANKALVRMF